MRGLHLACPKPNWIQLFLSSLTFDPEPKIPRFPCIRPPPESVQTLKCLCPAAKSSSALRLKHSDSAFLTPKRAWHLVWGTDGGRGPCVSRNNPHSKAMHIFIGSRLSDDDMLQYIKQMHTPYKVSMSMLINSANRTLKRYKHEF